MSNTIAYIGPGVDVCRSKYGTAVEATAGFAGHDLFAVSDAMTVGTNMIWRHFRNSIRAEICHAFAGSIDTSSFAFAILRMSSVIRIEQYLGPHIEQKWALLNVSCGSVSSW